MIIIEWLDALRHALAGTVLGLAVVGGLIATGLAMWSGRIERRTVRRESAAETVPIPSPVSPPSPGGVRPGEWT